MEMDTGQHFTKYRSNSLVNSKFCELARKPLEIFRFFFEIKILNYKGGMIRVIHVQNDLFTPFDLMAQILPIIVKFSFNYHETFSDSPPTVTPTQMLKSGFLEDEDDIGIILNDFQNCFFYTRLEFPLIQRSYNPSYDFYKKCCSNQNSQ